MPYIDINKKADWTKRQSAPPYSHKDIEMYEAKYAHSPIAINILEVWFVNHALLMRCIYANNATYDATGYTHAELTATGKRFRKILFYAGDYDMAAQVHEHLHKPENRKETVRKPIRYICKNGEINWYLNSFQWLKPAKSRAHGLLMSYYEPMGDELLNGKEFKIMIAEKEFKARRDLYEKLDNTKKKILLLLSRGFCTREIAEKLHLGEKTIDKYRKEMKKQLALGNDLSLLCFACHTAAYLQTLKIKENR
jgi:DNA-binding CsgD family transcriptional regulator